VSTSSVRTKFAHDIARIALPDARAAMLARTSPLPLETVAILAASGRVVAQSYRAGDDIVPFARSAMDGYALRAADTDAASGVVPIALPVAFAIFAGDGAASLVAGTASAITTGAMLPAGADAVVPFEDIDRVGDAIVLRAPLAPLDHVFEPGDDAKRGDVLVPANTVLTPGGAALLAAAGIGRVAVHRRPRIAIVSTGNEVVAIEANPRPGQIRNSNATMLAALLSGDGADVVFCEHALDDVDAVRATIERAIASADLVITTGGASTGERDYVKRTLRDLGADFAFDSIALRPAKPTGFASFESAQIAVLPGNPAAAYVAYVALVRGVIRRFAGHLQPYAQPVTATLRGTIHSKANRHFLMFAMLSLRDGRLDVTPLENQCSSLVRTSADANALIVVEPGTATVSSGALVQCEVLRPLEMQ